MMRNWWKINLSRTAVAVIAMAGTTVFAANLGVVVNGDMERESRFAPHGTPGVDHPNGYADAWHHSANSAWSGVVGGPMSVSPTHSLYIPDERVSDHDEMRSFAAALPAVGNPSRTLDLSWMWKWDITSAVGDEFSATVRISKGPVTGLDLSGAITDHTFLTGGAASSGGFVPFLTSIPLAPDDASFDIIFRTRDNLGDSSETGVMFVDDVAGVVPEPATMGLLGLASMGLMMVSRRRRG